jgi:ubiquinone/menaquinone biosynthesis C-methylase UbiE
MAEKIIEIEEGLKKKYTEFYAKGQSEWRGVGAKQKVENILKVAGGKTFNKVLEVGAGDGSILELLDTNDQFKELYAVEISATAVEEINKKDLKKLKSSQLFDGYRIPFEDKYFDLVIFSHVLEHVEFPRLILRDIARVSKEQIIEVPRDYKYVVDKRIDILLAYGHIDVYTPTLLRFLLISEGFEIINDRRSFVSKEVLLAGLKENNKTGWIHKLRVNIFVFLRTIAYHLVTSGRKETMINAYTVLTKSK